MESQNNAWNTLPHTTPSFFSLPVERLAGGARPRLLLQDWKSRPERLVSGLPVCLLSETCLRSVQTCLSTKTTPETVLFSQFHPKGDAWVSEGMNGIVEEGQQHPEAVKMQCMPLYSLLLALGNPVVDFLSLDIEGPEYQVLLNIPWDKVDIRALSVETQFLNPATREQLMLFLDDMGFTHLGGLQRDNV